MSIEIDHLGIAVRSLEEGRRFYERVLGMSVSTQETVEPERVNVAMLPTGIGSDAPRIELLEATDSDSIIGKFIQSRGPGIHHVALRVDNLASAMERLQAEGARVLHAPREGAGGHVYVFVHPASTGGVLLELIQK